MHRIYVLAIATILSLCSISMTFAEEQKQKTEKSTYNSVLAVPLPPKPNPNETQYEPHNEWNRLDNIVYDVKIWAKNILRIIRGIITPKSYQKAEAIADTYEKAAENPYQKKEEPHHY